jgi:DNA-directed RNA polymerase specialized sigma24 family protein
MLATELPVAGEFPAPANSRVMLRAKERQKLERRAERLAVAREALREAIVEARERGATLREIGDAIGMSHTGVAKWLKRP